MSEPKPAQILFRKNGDLVLEDEAEGTTVAVGHFDRKTGHLEFETRESSVKLIRQVTAAIGTRDKGTQSSGLSIVSMSVKGEARDTPKNVPKRPKRDPQFGDQTPELVEWYFKYYPKEANIRYGVYVDPDGEPIRRNVKRRLEQFVDDRGGESGIEALNDGKGVQVGPKKWENGPVGLVKYEDKYENQIIARRATHMTFAPSEVIGSFDTGDDEDQLDNQGEDGGDA